MDTTKKIMEDLQQLVQEEPQTIASISVNLKERKELLIEAYNQCDLCGSELEFTHVTDFIHEEVIEESLCPCCNINNEQTAHRLQ